MYEYKRKAGLPAFQLVEKGMIFPQAFFIFSITDLKIGFFYGKTIDRHNYPSLAR
jgi:hypothetical protein